MNHTVDDKCVDAYLYNLFKDKHEYVSESEVYKFYDSFGGIQDFSNIFEKWIIFQCQLFLSINSKINSPGCGLLKGCQLSSPIESNNIVCIESIKNLKSHKIEKDIKVESQTYFKDENSSPTPNLSSTNCTPMKLKLQRMGVHVEVVQESLASSDISDVAVAIDRNHDNVIRNMSFVYAHLVKHQCIPISDVIHYLTKICTLTVPIGTRLSLHVTGSTVLPSLLLDDSDLCLFAAYCVYELAPIFRALSNILPLLVELLGNEKVKSRAPEAFFYLVRYCNSEHSSSEAGFMGDSRDDSGLLGLPGKLQLESQTGSFVRRFRDEVDDRNEYKSQIECAVYNERERCFDEFSNLFRQFQQANRSDWTGSKSDEFWQSLPIAGSRVLGIRDCNIPWFADIFKSMLLFYGLNVTEGFVKETGEASSLMTSNNNTEKPVVNATKSRLLEARLGQEGKGQIAGARRPMVANQSRGSAGSSHGHKSGVRPGPDSSQSSQRLRQLYASFEDPSAHFPGNQQFFFRFIAVTNNFCFCRCLTASIASEIAVITNDRSDVEMDADDAHADEEEDRPDVLLTNTLPDYKHAHTPTSKISISASRYAKESLDLITSRLRILGRFLGFLTFWPQWDALSLGGPVLDGPLKLQSRESFQSWRCLRDKLPLCEMIRTAYHNDSLSLTVPWVVEYLRMTAWIPQVQSGSHICATSMAYHSALVMLWSLQRSSKLALQHGGLSGNRMYVILELQGLFETFPDIKASAITFEECVKYLKVSAESGSRKVMRQTSRRLDFGVESDADIDGADASLSVDAQNSLMDRSSVSGQSTVQLRWRWLSEAVADLQQRRKAAQRAAASVSVIPVHVPTVTSRKMPSVVTTTLLSPGFSTPTKSRKALAAAESEETPVQDRLLLSKQLSSPSIQSKSSSGLTKQQTPAKGTSRSQGNSSVSIVAGMGPTNVSGGNLSSSPSISNMTSKVVPKKTNNIQDSLVMSFWQQHPTLHESSLFFLEQVHRALRARIRIVVMESVHRALAVAEQVRGEGMQQTSIEFQRILDNEFSRIHSQTVSDMRVFVEDFGNEYTTGVLKTMFEVFPSHPRVRALALLLTTKQLEAQKPSHLNFGATYLKRKLNEVRQVSTNQFDRAVVRQGQKNSTETLDVPAETSDKPRSIEPPHGTSHSMRGIGSSATTKVFNNHEEGKAEARLSAVLHDIYHQVIKTKKINGNDNNSQFLVNMSESSFIDSFMTSSELSRYLVDFDFLFPFIDVDAAGEATEAPVHATQKPSRAQGMQQIRPFPIDSRPKSSTRLTNHIIKIFSLLKQLVDTLSAAVASFNQHSELQNVQSSVESYEKTSTSNATEEPPPAPVKAVAWGKSSNTYKALGLVQGADKRDDAKQQKKPLSQADFYNFIYNTTSLFLGVFRSIWYHWDTLITIKVDGHTTVETAKLLTLTAPGVLFMDAFVDAHDDPYRLPPPTSSPSATGSTSSPEVKVNSIVDGKQSSRLVAEAVGRPADVILYAEEKALLSIHSVARLLSMSSKPTTLTFFESCRGLQGAQRSQAQSVLDLVGRYLVKKCIISSQELVDWYRNSSTCQVVKDSVGEDLATLVRQLTTTSSK